VTPDQRLDAIMAVMECAFDPYWREAWTRQQVANSLAMPHTHAILVDSRGCASPPSVESVAGFALSRRAPGEVELLLVAVLPGLRSRGLGGTLLALFEKDARSCGAERIFLEMRADNPAERLYRRAGFTPMGRRPDYYTTIDGGRLDAITFAKDL